MLMQTLSRPNDRNGNPYRLILVYDGCGNLVTAYEARSSSPNITGELRRRLIAELPGFHLAPVEYNETRRMAAYRVGVMLAD